MGKISRRVPAPIPARPSDMVGVMDLESIRVYFLWKLREMAPGVLEQLHKALGGAKTHNASVALDQMMAAVLIAEEAAVARDGKRFTEALLRVFFFARDVTVLQGKLKTKEIPPV